MERAACDGRVVQDEDQLDQFALVERIKERLGSVALRTWGSEEKCNEGIQLPGVPSEGSLLEGFGGYCVGDSDFQWQSLREVCWGGA